MPEGAKRADFNGLQEWDGQTPTRNKLMSLEDRQKPEGVPSVTIYGRSYAFVVGDFGSYLKTRLQTIGVDKISLSSLKIHA